MKILKYRYANIHFGFGSFTIGGHHGSFPLLCSYIIFYSILHVLSGYSRGFPRNLFIRWKMCYMSDIGKGKRKFIPITLIFRDYTILFSGYHSCRPLIDPELCQLILLLCLRLLSFFFLFTCLFRIFFVCVFCILFIFYSVLSRFVAFGRGVLLSVMVNY